MSLELIVGDESIFVRIDFIHDVLPELSRAVGRHLALEHVLQLAGANGAISVGIEYVEGSANVLLR